MGIVWNGTIELFWRRVLYKKKRYFIDYVAKGDRTIIKFKIDLLFFQLSKLFWNKQNYEAVDWKSSSKL